MSTVGVFEAKTRLSSLLERVERGEQVTITKHGTPVAKLVPVAGIHREGAAHAVARLRQLRKGMLLRGLSVQALKNEGRP